jgi:hypothetical protein
MGGRFGAFLYDCGMWVTSLIAPSKKEKERSEFQEPKKPKKGE